MDTVNQFRFLTPDLCVKTQGPCAVESFKIIHDLFDNSFCIRIVFISGSEQVVKSAFKPCSRELYGEMKESYDSDVFRCKTPEEAVEKVKDLVYPWGEVVE